MNPRQWALFASWARTIAGAAALVFAGRFAWVSISAALAKTAIPTAPASSSQPPRGQDRTHVDPSSAPTATNAPTSPVSSGTAIRITAMITAGPDRSEVFVDDTDVGKTPYVGDISCRAGEKVHVRIVPLQGAPIDLDRPCKQGTLKVEP